MTMRTWDTTPISIEGTNGWDSAHVAVRGEKFCPWWLTYLRPTTGEIFDVGKPCRSFSHRRCAEKRVADLLHHIGPFILNSRREIWVAVGQYDEGLATRMRVRRNKVKAATGEAVEAFWVRRNTNVFYYFASTDVPGDSEPRTGRWMQSETAFVVARAALTVPGVGDHQGRKGINFTQAWRPAATQRQSNELQRLAQERPTASRIAAEAAQRLGSGPPVPARWGDGWERPHSVELGAWNAMVNLVAEEITADAR